ncbi:hypothetical protein AZE42_08062 [Rhizopogon vesiculosus]|uniref:Uncharacterized protein n=1 Tax=Rhizopogon vesiculosus TaxID=180088 RepID=A0A1J8PK80_9AGAM|nr:hypothetical protein AZE42_08062 [Rhizopogon vesiculosus]
MAMDTDSEISMLLCVKREWLIKAVQREFRRQGSTSPYTHEHSINDPIPNTDDTDFLEDIQVQDTSVPAAVPREEKSRDAGAFFGQPYARKAKDGKTWNRGGGREPSSVVRPYPQYDNGINPAYSHSTFSHFPVEVLTGRILSSLDLAYPNQTAKSLFFPLPLPSELTSVMG